MAPQPPSIWHPLEGPGLSGFPSCHQREGPAHDPLTGDDRFDGVGTRVFTEPGGDVVELTRGTYPPPEI